MIKNDVISTQRDNMCYFWKFGKWLICWISRVVGVAEKCLIWVDKKQTSNLKITYNRHIYVNY